MYDDSLVELEEFLNAKFVDFCFHCVDTIASDLFKLFQIALNLFQCLSADVLCFDYFELQ